ncbi:MAG: hypothetical protein ACRDH5_16385, partial [bacterium]
MGSARSRIPVAIPWAVAAVSMCLAAAAWLAPPVERARPDHESPRESSPTVSELESKLAVERAENAALRGELDRLVGRLPREKREAVTRGEVASPEARPAVAEESKELATRYRDDVVRAIGGDEEARDAAYRGIMELVRRGPDAFPALRDAYRGTADPQARAIILRALISGRGSELPEFVAAELRGETDTELRRALAAKASELATPSAAGTFETGFLEVLGDDADPEVRAAAVRGLRYAAGEPVEQALLAAAGDASEDVRL